MQPTSKCELVRTIRAIRELVNAPTKPDVFAYSELIGGVRYWANKHFEADSASGTVPHAR